MVPLLMSAINVSEELSAAALCRGLDNPGPHTSLVQVRFHRSDIIVWCATCALAVTALTRPVRFRLRRYCETKGILYAMCGGNMMKLHASGEDYLEAVLMLQKEKGVVRSVDVARHMGVSKPSVCHAVALLKDGGFLTMDEDFFLRLTDVGREVAESIYERHCFFTEQLIAVGVDPKVAEADACRIEHIISTESFERLKEAREGRR